MKTLKKFLNPKAQWHPTRFPLEPTPDKLIEFFHSKNFTCMLYDSSDAYHNGGNINAYFNYKINRAKKNTYMFEKNKNRCWFRFAKYSKDEVSIDNPIFSMYFKLDSQGNYYELVGCHTCGTGIQTYEDFYDYDYHNFVDKVNKHFGWQ